MIKKKVLVDLAKLKVINSGLGQVAYNYGQEFNKVDTHDFQLYLLTPPKYVKYFGNRTKYLSNRPIYKVLPFCLPHFDLWHSTHQLSSILPCCSKTPYLLTVHDLNFLYEKTHEKAAQYLKKVQKRVDRACVITTISEFSAREIRLHLDLKGKDVRVIHNGVRLNKDNTFLHPPFVCSEKPFFFTIGQVVEKKNFDCLLDLMSHFPEKNLYICGESFGSYANSIRDRIETEKIENVFLTGTISDDQKGWLYEHCEAFVFPSKFEGFGLPVIEAMQCGKPVFSSDMTSLSEIGDRYAYFWKSFNPEYMARIVNEGLEHFYSDTELAKNQIKYAESYSYEKHINSYLSLYREILDSY
jgi:glycosyltransferase involved in cell wall biosynthesis